MDAILLDLGASSMWGLPPDATVRPKSLQWRGGCRVNDPHYRGRTTSRGERGPGQPQTRWATSAISRSLRSSPSSLIALPGPAEANPHWVESGELIARLRSDRLVPAGADPVAVVVAVADVQSERDPGNACDLVERVGAFAHDPLERGPGRRPRPLLGRIDQLPEVRGVDLDVGDNRQLTPWSRRNSAVDNPTRLPPSIRTSGSSELIAPARSRPSPHRRGRRRTRRCTPSRARRRLRILRRSRPAGAGESPSPFPR